MRILIAYSTRYPFVRGGVDTMIVSLVDQLRPDHDVILFAAGEPEETELSCSIVDGIKTYAMHLRLPYYSKFKIKNFIAWMLEFPRTLLRIRRMTRNEQIEVIHLHMLNRYNLAFAVLRMLGGPPYIVTLHRAEVLNYETDRWISRMISRIILRNSSQTNAVSQWLAAKAKATIPYRNNIGCVPNGIDKTVSANVPKQELEAELGLHLPKSFFTVIGTLQKYKAQDIAIRAWAQLAPEFPDLHLFIVGEGKLKQQYQSLIETLGCSETVHLTGQLSRDAALSLAFFGTGVVFPSRNEGQGYVLLEAGIMGLPVICSDIGPFVELVEDKVEAIVTLVDDPKSVASAVAEIIQNPDYGQQLGLALNHLVLKNYTSETMASNYVKMYVEASKP